MTIGLVDVLIIIFIALGAAIGFKNGMVKTGVSFVGVCIVAIISFIFKDKLMIMMYENLPFFNFFGLVRGLNAINILLYQMIAFLIIFIALTFILKVLIGISGILEWLLKQSIFLNVPSKILGTIIGAIQYYLYAFVILFVLSFPAFNIEPISNSKIATDMLNDTPIISEYTKDTAQTYKDIYIILKNKKKKTNIEVNTEVLVALLDNKLISIESAKQLVEQNKIIITDESILDNYQESDLYKKLNDMLENK